MGEYPSRRESDSPEGIGRTGVYGLGNLPSSFRCGRCCGRGGV
nr:MAG TPA: hypothetical protein [Caudoviricetes sp.]